MRIKSVLTFVFPIVFSMGFGISAHAIGFSTFRDIDKASVMRDDAAEKGHSLSVRSFIGMTYNLRDNDYIYMNLSAAESLETPAHLIVTTDLSVRLYASNLKKNPHLTFDVYSDDAATIEVTRTVKDAQGKIRTETKHVLGRLEISYLKSSKSYEGYFSFSLPLSHPSIAGLSVNEEESELTYKFVLKKWN